MNFFTGVTNSVVNANVSDIPSVDNQYDIGTTLKRFRDGHFVNVYGDTVVVGGADLGTTLASAQTQIDTKITDVVTGTFTVDGLIDPVLDDTTDIGRASKRMKTGYFTTVDSSAITLDGDDLEGILTVNGTGVGLNTTAITNLTSLVNLNTSKNQLVSSDALVMSVAGTLDSTAYKEGGVSGELVKIDGSSIRVGPGSAGSSLNNVSIGNNSASSGTTGYFNTYLGNESGVSATTGHNNTGVGFQVLENNIVGVGNTALGVNAGRFTGTNYNVAIGLGSQKSAALTSGAGENTSVGFNSLAALTTGERNVAIGHFCGMGITTGSLNTHVGYKSEFDSTNSTECTSLGASTNTDSGTNMTSIGYGVGCSADNQVSIGNSSVTTNIFHGDVSSDSYTVDDYKIQQTGTDLTIAHTDGSSFLLSQAKPTATKSYPTAHVDYTTMLPRSMRVESADLIAGNNKFWGESASYIAGEPIIAGRIVSLLDTTVGSDNANVLKIGYLRNGTDVVGGVFPVGISQTGGATGSTIIVCTKGYTSLTLAALDFSPDRGSIVIAAAGAGSDGKGLVGTASSADRGIVGFVAQSDGINNPGESCLVYINGWFEPI
jgi:hypothetical protein